MSEQDPREELLREVVGISVGVPYSATIKSGDAEFSGQAIFSTEDRLTFEFFSEDKRAYLRIFDVLPPEADLHIDSLDLCWKVLITNETQKLWGSESFLLTINGIVQATWFGGAVRELTSIVVGYGSIPTGWAGNAPGSYYEGYNRDRLGKSTIEGLQLNYAGWSVHLHEVPDHRVIGSVRHTASIKGTHTFSSCDAEIFLSDLHLFFSFLFGGSSGMVFAKSRKDYKSLWGGLGRRIPQPPGRLQNWYSRSHMPPGRQDLSNIFKSFCEMRTDDKAIISSIITHYATSEELVERNDVAELLPAFVLSYSALEGLVRWTGYSHPDIREEFFRKPKGRAERDRQDQERRLAKDKSLVDLAICVLGSENINAEENRSVVKQLQKDRDSIVHASNMHALDTEVFAGWNRTQCLVEALILRKLGYAGVLPNRTRGDVWGELRLDAQAPRCEEGVTDGRGELCG